jgi:hypothetical protein
MKSMTCKQLGGACNEVFSAETFDEIAALSQAHGKEMFKIKDPAHMQAMSKMTELMHNPADMQKWMDARRAEFNAL